MKRHNYVFFLACLLATGCSNTGHTHAYRAAWDFDNSNHWHTCSVEGCGQQGSIESHNLIERIIKAATYEEDGSKRMVCSICGYSSESTIVIPRLTHNYSSTWSSDSSKHWHSCTDAGYFDLRKDEANHAFPEQWSNNGINYKLCTVCGYRYNEPSSELNINLTKDNKVTLTDSYGNATYNSNTGDVTFTKAKKLDTGVCVLGKDGIIEANSKGIESIFFKGSDGLVLETTLNGKKERYDIANDNELHVCGNEVKLIATKDVLISELRISATGTNKADHNYQLDYDSVTKNLSYICECGKVKYCLDNKNSLNNTENSLEFNLFSGNREVFIELDHTSNFAMDVEIDGVTSSKNIGSENRVSLGTLAEGYHKIVLKNKTAESKANITDIDLGDDGYVVKKDGVLVELDASTNKEWKNNYRRNFNVYVPTATKNYYVKYMFQWEHSTTRENYNANSTTNISMPRIKTAFLVHVTNDNEAITTNTITTDESIQVLQSGEISLAASLINPEGVKATDFIGGYHGDERYESIDLRGEGNELKVINSSGFTKEVKAYSYLSLDLVSSLFEWGTSVNSTDISICFGKRIAEHHQYFLIDSVKGVRNHQTLKMVLDGYQANDLYLQMLTMRRLSDSTLVTESLGMYLEDETAVGFYEGPKNIKTEINVLNGKANHIHYWSNSSHIECDAGFSIPEGSDANLKESRVKIRVDGSQGDNKLYCAFNSKEGGNTLIKDNNMTVDVYYRIDYKDFCKNNIKECIQHNYQFVEHIDDASTGTSYDLYKCSNCDKEEQRNIVSNLTRVMFTPTGYQTDATEAWGTTTTTSDVSVAFAHSWSQGPTTAGVNTFSGNSIINNDSDEVKLPYQYDSNRFATIKGGNAIDSNGYHVVTLSKPARLVFYLRAVDANNIFGVTCATSETNSEEFLVGSYIPQNTPVVRCTGILQAGTYYVSRICKSGSASTKEFRIYGIEVIF